MTPEIKKEKLSKLMETKFMNVYEYPFGENGHYYTATRRKSDDIIMLKSDEEYKAMLADAVSIIVIIRQDGQEPKVLMNYEFRYPVGRFIMAPPAGLIDPEDKAKPDPLFQTAIREVKEETGIEIKETDHLSVVNPLLFSSPGMTDECNAIVCAILDNPELKELNHDGSVGSEVFNGFELLDKEKALHLLKEGMDKNGYYYSVYTWIALMYFVSDLWK